ncbi:acyl-CoA thioesterase [Psychroflexus tropicus]|uniref:acyl-CoA thioesterase n=1 Tax=Psychroflexus tropicus TaxID=197345 RepID=UPI00037FA9FD|nr:thioesterase family protein [Psychroflexus tropicus]
MSKKNKGISPISVHSEVEVRYAETDQMGVVHHSVYPIYFEQARVDWLREVGMHYQKMEDNGIMLPLSKLTVDYKKPAKFGDILNIETSLHQLPTASILFDYKIKNQSNELLCLGQTVLVFVNKSTRRPIRCPEEIMTLITSAIPKD